MKLPEICIKKPVLAIVLSLVLVVLGVVGFSRLELLFFPRLVLPIVTIYTHYQGASSELMESQITTPLENSVAGVDNVQSISSSSWTGGSSITVQFRLGGDFESEAAQVRDKVSGERQKLPSDADAPSITVGVKGSELIDIGITDKSRSSQEIRDYAESYIQPAFRQLDGVGQVAIDGASDYAMRIWLNSQEMAAKGVTVADIKTALTANNIYFPAGQIREPNRNFSIVSNTQLKNAVDFSKIIIRRDPAGIVRLSDVAQVELGHRSLTDSPLYINGQEGLLLRIKPLQSANPLQVAKRIKLALSKLQHNLPPGMKISVVYDASQFLRSSVMETFKSIGEAVILVILVTMLFIGSLRASLIPIVTIPVSLIGVFGFIYVLDYSINIMSLLAIVLAIGLVVDDAIVMLENIHRHIEHGMSPMDASLKGCRELSGAVIAMSLTLVAVYAPIGMIQGFTAVLFQQFAFTLAGAVVISAFVALTLSPMMCSRVLPPGQLQNKFADKIDRVFSVITRGYQAFLTVCLNARFVVLLALVGIAVFGVFIFKDLSSEFLPQEDFGIFNVGITSPTGANLAYTLRYMDQIEKIITQFPEVTKVINQVSTGSATMNGTLKPWGVRTTPTQDILKKINPLLSRVPGVDASAYVPDVIDYGEQGSDITLNFMTARDYVDLLPSIDAMMTKLKAYPGVQDVQTNLKYNSQQFAITLDRGLAAELGVNIQDVADTVSAMMSGNHWSDVQSGNRSYQVIVQMQQQDLKNFNGLGKLYVRSAPDAQALTHMIPVSSLIKLTPRISQGTLTHFNRMRSGYISARLAPGYAESDVIQYINKVAPEAVTPEIRTAYSGKSEQFLESSGKMAGLVAMSFIFIYLVLAAQFGSFLDPFIILIAVPFSMVGGLLFLKLGGGTFNLYSQIGLVTLIGLISKHGILITQFINELREQGRDIRTAIVDGATIRLRPVLMTTAAMVFGTLPLAMASGPGSIGRHQIGWVIIGGLICGTFFSLVVVPVVYSFLGRFKRVNVSA